MKVFWGSLLFVSLLTSCATSPSRDQGVSADFSEESTELEDSLDLSLSLAQQRALDRLQKQSLVAEGGVIESSKPATAHKYLIPTRAEHPKVQKWIDYYSQKDRERFQRFLNRGARYKEIIQDLFVTHGLPPDLYYLGILESGYVTEAVSRAGAVGPWQFMAPTGREYGLKINSLVDERLDIVRSTLAAIRYLKELHRQKKSWHLALAAYNAGPGRVRRAMRRGGTQNYWSLTSRYLLPYDTREYIPQFLAILHIGQNLQQYEFVEAPLSYLPPVRLVKAPTRVSLEKISEVTGIDLIEIKDLNPHLLRGVTPPHKEDHYRVWVKLQDADRLLTSFDVLKQHQIEGLHSVTRSIAEVPRSVQVHRVRPGQNLSQIAQRYGTSVAHIKKMNGLKQNKIFVGQRLRVRSPKEAVVKTVARYHRVRSGDNLTEIARKHGLSVEQLKNYNDLQHSKIYQGQRLKLYPNVTEVVATESSAPTRYKIRKGDNLYKIAKKFGLTVKRIKELNNLKSNQIQKGQILKLAAN